MIKYTCKLILVLFVTALLWEGDLLAFKLLAGNWSHQGNPMESNWIICTDGMPADAPARIKNGASVWNYSKFTFSFGTDSCDSGGIYPLVNDLNQIDFGGDLGEGVLAENTNWFFTNAPGNTTECDMRFSNSFNWNTSSSDPSSDQQDWQSVAAHEMGHCLGLDHEDGLPTIDPVMTSGIAPGKTKRNPTSDDIAGRNAIYGDSGTGGTTTTSTTTTIITTTSTTTTMPPLSGEAKLEVSFDPNPAFQSQQGDWEVNPFVKETNGVGVTITSFEIRGGSGAILLSGNTSDFVTRFNKCGTQPNGFIPGFDTACANLTRAGSPGVDTFTFLGIDENGNSIQASGSVTLLSDTTSDKSFTFNCEHSMKQGFFGLETLTMNVGDTENCTLKLTNHEPDKTVEISTQLMQWFGSTIVIEPTRSVTDTNGELEITLTALSKGMNWAAWAVPDNKNVLEFNKKAYDTGLAWGMFVKVE